MFLIDFMQIFLNKISTKKLFRITLKRWAKKKSMIISNYDEIFRRQVNVQQLKIIF